MKKPYLWMTCLLLPVALSAQQQERITHQLKFSPLRLLNYAAPGIELSYEIGRGRLSTELSAAYLVDLVHYLPERPRLNGIRVALEEKIFVKSMRRGIFRLYASPGVGYHHVEIIAKEQFWKAGGDYWARYNKRDNSLLLNAKCGMQFRRKHLVIDYSMGFGLLERHVTDYNKPRDMKISADFLNGLERAGQHEYFNLLLSLKIGYLF
jgi:hypothetical protein